MVSQILFGEDFVVLEKKEKWSKIKLDFDSYEGYIDNKQCEEISENDYKKLLKSKKYMAGELINSINSKDGGSTNIFIGSTLPFYNDTNFRINTSSYTYKGSVYHYKLPKKHISKTALLYLNAPYLWGGKTPFGIDCSGFTQMVYKLCGYKLLRDAKQQATQGKILGFIEESEPGDLAFFDNEERIITHVGIIIKDNYIIHAHGKVRIDKLDSGGIYNTDIKRHTHKLRIIRKMI